MSHLDGHGVADWKFCKRALVDHSRTFALPIALLPEPLERGVTAAYLLCRIADTVEDTVSWPKRDKERLFRLFLDVLASEVDAGRFVDACLELPEPGPGERELLAGLPHVLRVFNTAPGHAAALPWIAELVRGMALYAQRPAGRDGIHALGSVADLERYCYFVAGSIGQLLTELFSSHLALDDDDEAKLRSHAEAFGRGLQLVNILRDMSGDLERGVCYIPREELLRFDLQPRDLVRAECSRRARQALQPLFALAQTSLEEAFEYVLALPGDARDVRGFCLVPLWLAIATLSHCQTDPRLLESGTRVKLSRLEVGELIRECTLRASDDEALRRAFSVLQTRKPVVAA